MKLCLVFVDGPNFPRRFVLKELSVYFPHNDTYRHYLLKQPFDLWLHGSYTSTNNYHKRVLGGVGVDEHNEGSLDYYSHSSILGSLSDYCIMTVGHVATKFLRKALPHSQVLDLQDLSPFKYPLHLNDACCGVQHNPRYCSLAKLWYVKSYLDANPLNLELE